MGTMDRRPDSTLPAASPADEPESFDEFCRRHGAGSREPATTSARRKPVHGKKARRAPRPRRPWYSVPTFRKLAELLARLLPPSIRGSKAAEVARRNPGLTAWLILFTAVGLTVVAPDSGTPHPGRNPERYQAYLQARGQDAVRACIAEIGFQHAMVPAVRAGIDDRWIAGTYTPKRSTISFNARHVFGDAELLAVAAHESVHALFDQHSLRPYGGPHADFNILVEETAADVLGAHIAGDAWSRMGHDGQAFTDWLIDQHRKDCDPNRSGSIAHHYFNVRARDHSSFGGMSFRAALVHYGPLELVDAVARICEQERLARDAADAISKRFIRGPLNPADRSIRDEVKRRKREY
jgi:hypothetical protein